MRLGVGRIFSVFGAPEPRGSSGDLTPTFQAAYKRAGLDKNVS